MTKDLETLPQFSAHLVPCKIRYTGATSETADNFTPDLSESERIKHDPNAHVTYLRGRKLVGKDVKEIYGSNCTVLMLNQKLSSEPAESVQDSSKPLEPIATVTQVINYEREGNESRLKEELSRFEEFIQLQNLIHD